MTTLLNHPVLFFLVSLTVLALVTQAGYRLRQAHPASTEEALHEQVHDARDGIVFLLSLLLGFTLAMALTRYDHRKQLVVDEADAIGTTALRARLLPEPYDSRMTHLIADYSDARLKYFTVRDAKAVEVALEQAKQLQNQIWDITRDAARAAPTAITSSFIQSLNETIDLSEKQVASAENRIPLSTWVMIWIIAILACLASGLAVRRRLLISMVLTPLTAAVVMSLTADLDSPRSGLITAGTASIERIHSDLNASPNSKPKPDQ